MSLGLSIFLLCACLAIAKPINFTVDDRYGAWPASGLSQSINYGEGWFDGGIDKCNGCQFLPNMAGFRTALNLTWKRATYERTKPQEEPKIATFTFNGSAVYVNIIRAPTTAGGVRGNTAVLFTLDGVASRLEDDAKPVVFMQTAFAQPSLPQGVHTLTIQNGLPNGKHTESMIFLDSIIYTTDDSSFFNVDDSPLSNALSGTDQPSDTSQCNGANWVVIIVAGVGGVIAGILLTVLSVLILKDIKRRRSRRTSAIESFVSSGRLRRDYLFPVHLFPVPFLKALPTITPPASTNGRASSDIDSRRLGLEHRWQNRSTIRTLTSTRPPTYRTRESLVTQTGRRL